MESKERLQLAIEASIEAGKEIMTIYQQADLGVEYKNDNSPLTLALLQASPPREVTKAIRAVIYHIERNKVKLYFAASKISIVLIFKLYGRLKLSIEIEQIQKIV